MLLPVKMTFYTLLIESPNVGLVVFQLILTLKWDGRVKEKQGLNGPLANIIMIGMEGKIGPQQQRWEELSINFAKCFPFDPFPFSKAFGLTSQISSPTEIKMDYKWLGANVVREGYWVKMCNHCCCDLDVQVRPILAHIWNSVIPG